MALCCCMEMKKRREGIPKQEVTYERVYVRFLLEPCPLKNCISLPQMTAGALAVCCHLLSSLRCTDATCLQIGLLAKLQVMVVREGWPTWHCGWKVGTQAQQC